ncbi:hypothetical protein AAKU55_003060 [Oxalobacteraceae bacterium GrIS 1.11]
MHPHLPDLPQTSPCIIQAARDYSLPPRALLSVLLTEGGRPGTVSRNANGSQDHGPFQINTVWVRRLGNAFGIAPATLTNDFCWSARAGAYILRYEINQANGDFWEGIGHYHSRTEKFKHAYIAAVYRNSLTF